MTSIELKEKLIAKIGDTNDNELLQQISRLIDVETDFDNIYKLSQEEHRAVSEGVNQLDNGLFVSNDEAQKIFDKCLGK